MLLMQIIRSGLVAGLLRVTVTKPRGSLCASYSLNLFVSLNTGLNIYQLKKVF